MVPEAISAPYEGFRRGVCGIRGYCMEEAAERVSLAFEPWFGEPDRARNVPCLRLTFRRIGARVVLERFAVCDGAEEREIDLSAAHDAIQAWLDYACG